MIIKILKGNTIEGPLFYNFRKEGREVAELIGSDNVPFEPNMANARVFFNERAELNRRCTNPIFTVSLNPAPEDLDRITDYDFMKMSKEYMERMGYGEQPYLVFRHNDIERTHVHIVSVRVKKDGGVVSDNYEQRRSSTIRREMELKYNLTKAEDRRKDRQKEAEATRQTADKIKEATSLATAKDKRQFIRKAVRIASTYHCTDFKELNRVLSLYNVEAETVNAGTERRGVVFYATNGSGERVTSAIKGSSLGKDFSIKAIENSFSANSQSDERKNRREQTRQAIDKWITRATSKEELTELLKTDGIETLWQTNVKTGSATGVTFIDTVSRVVAKGSEIGKAYSAASIIDRISKNEPQKKEWINKEDFNLMLTECSALYREKRKDISKYYYESQLIEALGSMKSEFIARLDSNKELDKYSATQKLSVIEQFIERKEESSAEIQKKEQGYFLSRTSSLMPYLLTLEMERRRRFLDALSLEEREGYIQPKNNPMLREPLSTFSILDSDIPEKTADENTRPLKKQDRDMLLQIINGEVLSLDIKEYKPYHPLLSILNEKDKAAFTRRQIACEAERVFKSSGTVSSCITNLLEKGFLIVPVRLQDGNRTYALRDFTSSDTSTMVTVSDEIRERLDNLGYTENLLPKAREIVYNKWGGVNPSYRAVVRLARASSIESEDYREKMMEKTFKWLETYDKGLAGKMREKYKSGASVASVAAELEGQNLSKGRQRR